MTEATKQTGRCLCGAVHISVNKFSNKVGACHCGMYGLLKDLGASIDRSDQILEEYRLGD